MYVDFHHTEGRWMRSANRWGGTAASKPKAQQKTGKARKKELQPYVLQEYELEPFRKINTTTVYDNKLYNY